MSWIIVRISNFVYISIESGKLTYCREPATPVPANYFRPKNNNHRLTRAHVTRASRPEQTASQQTGLRARSSTAHRTTTSSPFTAHPSSPPSLPNQENKHITTHYPLCVLPKPPVPLALLIVITFFRVEPSGALFTTCISYCARVRVLCEARCAVGWREVGEGGVEGEHQPQQQLSTVGGNISAAARTRLRHVFRPVGRRGRDGRGHRQAYTHFSQRGLRQRQIYTAFARVDD